MAKNITYRKVVADDYHELRQFYMDVYYVDEPLAKIWGLSDTIESQTHELVSKAIHDDLSFVAVDSMKIIGLAMATQKKFDSKFLEKMFGGVDKVVVMVTLGVHRDYRRKGIARKLTELLQKESWLQGYQWLFVDTANNFARKLLDNLNFIQYDVGNVEDVMVNGKRKEVKIPDEIHKTYSRHWKPLVAVVNVELIQDVLGN